MILINALTSDADQLLNIDLPDGSNLALEFIYRAGSQRWLLNVNHPLITLNGVNLCAGPNILRQWRNVIPFGLALISADGLDPVDPNDFEEGRVSIYLLTAEEVQQVESEVLANT